MHLNYSFRKMETSESLCDFSTEKIQEKVDKFYSKSIEVHVTFSVEKEQHLVRCSVRAPHGFNFEVNARSLDMYGAVNLMVDKLERLLKRQKEKLKKHRFKNNVRDLKLANTKEKFDCDAVPIDAADLIKYEQARLKKAS